MSRTAALPWRERPAVPLPEPRSVAVTAVSAFVLTLLMSASVLPGLVDLLPALPTFVQLFVLLLLSSACRLLAGVFGARRHHAERDTGRRVDALASVALGAALAWAASVLLTVGVGVPVAGTAMLVLDGLRWVGEAVLGGLAVRPQAEPEERRYFVRSWR